MDKAISGGGKFGGAFLCPWRWRFLYTGDGVREAASWGLRQSRGFEFVREEKRSRSAVNPPASLAGAYPC